MMKVLSCFLLGCVVSTFASKIPRLFNGMPVTAEGHRKYYRFVLKIFIQGPYYGSMCTGTLVKRNLVVTAAHCFCSVEKPYHIRVLADTEKTEGDYYGNERRGYRIDENHLQEHCPDKDGRRVIKPGYDVALVLLSGPYYEIEPAPLVCEDLVLGTDVRILGFGFDQNGEKGTLRIGKAVTVPCLPIWKNDPICTANKGKLPALRPGDSGGPLLTIINKKFYLFGVNTETTVETPEVPARNVFESLGAHCQWIKSSKGATQHTMVIMTLMIQPFIVFVVLYF